MRRPAVRPVLPLLLAGLTVAGCSGGYGQGADHGHHGPPILQEIEPNDSPWEPDYLGQVHSLTHFIVEGHVEAVGWDLVDHFELQATEPVGIEFVLHGYHPHADLDLCLFDPDSGLIVACYDGPWNPETGFFTLDWPGKRVVLVVEAWLTDSSYDLEILATPHPWASDSDGPAAAGADLTSGSGISFPDGQPLPAPDKRGPERLDEEALAAALRNSEQR